MDLARVFVGDDGLGFLPEIVFRTVVLYSFAFVLVRTTARRTNMQLSVAELLIIVALGSAVGDPMFYADVPLAHGMVVVGVVVLLEKLLGKVISRSDHLERWIEGTPVRVIDGGALDLDGLARGEIAHDEVAQLLRIQGVRQLGEVRAAYLEQDGSLSVFRYDDHQTRPGLPIEPPAEIAPRLEIRAGAAAPGGPCSCLTCGFTITPPAGQVLREHTPGHGVWTPAEHRISGAEAADARS